MPVIWLNGGHPKICLFLALNLKPWLVEHIGFIQTSRAQMQVSIYKVPPLSFGTQEMFECRTNSMLPIRYFKRGNLYGLSCFENMKVDNEEERGARMKSVGVLAKSYALLHLYMPFLQEQVRHLLEKPGSYNELLQFYLKWRGPPTLQPELQIERPYKTICDGMHSMEITHPAGCFSQFMNYFGEKIFLLWKFALLRKRVLFFSPPPIGVVCYRVYCTSTLVAHVYPDMETCLCPPNFYVNVTDIDVLAGQTAYVACTTEKIFESKPTLFDIFVDQQNLETSSPANRKLMELSVADKLKYSHLLELRSKCQPLMVNHDTDESWFTGFFMAQNTQLFKELFEVSKSADKLWTEEHMKRVGLDPSGDRQFLSELVERYGIDIVLITDSACCPA
ncbi:DENN domain-containing protein 11-like isoform X2 [Ornithodoros turicata]|uniref:DENN domain-containing protein 11-like isoform X2 n=1 Tax=Ornithodoros turicata TaxID=34597 RepID=UPI003139F2B1